MTSHPLPPATNTTALLERWLRAVDISNNTGKRSNVYTRTLFALFRTLEPSKQKLEDNPRFPVQNNVYN